MWGRDSCCLILLTLNPGAHPFPLLQYWLLSLEILPRDFYRPHSPLMTFNFPIQSALSFSPFSVYFYSTLSLNPQAWLSIAEVIQVGPRCIHCEMWHLPITQRHTCELSADFWREALFIQGQTKPTWLLAVLATAGFPSKMESYPQSTGSRKQYNEVTITDRPFRKSMPDHLPRSVEDKPLSSCPF